MNRRFFIFKFRNQLNDDDDDVRCGGDDTEWHPIKLALIFRMFFFISRKKMGAKEI